MAVGRGKGARKVVGKRRKKGGGTDEGPKIPLASPFLFYSSLDIIVFYFEVVRFIIILLLFFCLRF